MPYFKMLESIYRYYNDQNIKDKKDIASLLFDTLEYDLTKQRVKYKRNFAICYLYIIGYQKRYQETKKSPFEIDVERLCELYNDLIHESESYLKDTEYGDSGEYMYEYIMEVGNNFGVCKGSFQRRYIWHIE